PTNARSLRDCRFAHPLRRKLKNSSGLCARFGRSTPLASEFFHSLPFLLHSRSHSINGSLAFKLSKGAQYVKEEPAIRRGQVDVVGERYEADVVIAEIRDGIHEVLDIPAPAV